MNGAFLVAIAMRTFSTGDVAIWNEGIKALAIVPSSQSDMVANLEPEQAWAKALQLADAGSARLLGSADLGRIAQRMGELSMLFNPAWPSV